jgi:hypothetical protein
MTTLSYSETLTVVHCHCGIAVGIPQNLARVMHDEGESKHAYCPLGHRFVFGDSYKEKLETARAELERAQRRAQATRELLHAEERSHSATRGHLTRTKKRVGNGVCPCCKRSFENLARHMTSKHPDYKKENGA